MQNQQLIEYIKQQLSLNVARDVITTNLKSQGWTMLDISQAFMLISNQNVSQANSIPSNDILPSSLSSQSQQSQQAESQVISNSINPNFSTVNKKSKKIFLFIIIFIGLGFIGGAGYAYYSGAFLSLSSLTSKSIDNIRNANSASYDTTITVDYSEMKEVADQASQLITGGIIPTKFSLTTKGVYDFSNTNNKKISSLISVDAGSFSTIVNFLVTDSIFYGKFVKFPTIYFMSMLNQHENKWFSFPLKAENTEDLNNIFNPISQISFINSDIIDKVTPEQEEQLYQITRNAHFIKTVKRLSPEIINEKLSYHFIFDLDREGINDYLKSLKEYVNDVGKNDSSLSAFDPTAFSKNLENIQNFKGEIWIGRKDNLPYKIVLDFTVKFDEKKDKKIKVNVVSIFNEWNKPVFINAPEESTPFEKLISDTLGQATEKAKDASIKSNLANLRAEAELYYDSQTNQSYLGFCSSPVVKNINTKLEDSEFTCIAKATKYAVGAKLEGDSNYFCVDSTGFSRNVKGLPTDAVCPN